MSKLNVNLGSGIHLVAGFTNVDAFIDPKDVKKKKGAKYIQASMTALPFEDNTVDYIECLEAIEHLSFVEVPKAVQEMYRVLKPGGVAYIFTTNFDDIAQQWTQFIEGKDFDAHNWITLTSIIYGNQMHAGEFHRSAFNPAFFNGLMQACGFTKFEMVGYLRGALPPKFKGAKWPKKPLNTGTIAVTATK